VVKTEREGWEGRYKRARADYINLERRVKEQQEEFLKFANSVLVTKLLPILDDLEKAAQASDDDGLGLLLKNFGDVLKSEGVQEIKVKKGDDFDPHIMECAESQGTGEEVEVAEVIRKGYKMRDKVIRPARVRVG
jgi:molecular chaperone GrpE